MIALIDARNTDSFSKLFDITLIERILRQVWVVGVREAYLYAPKQSVNLKGEFIKKFPMKFGAIRALEELPKDQNDVMIFDGSAIYDDRIIDALTKSENDVSIIDGRNPHTPIAVRYTNNKTWSSVTINDKKFTEVFKSSTIKDIQTMDTYVKFLRKSYIPTLRFVKAEDNLRTIENDLFEKTFKSGLEWIAIYGYKIPVREMTRLCAKISVTPNQITAVAIFCRWASIPLLFGGWLALGLSLIVLFVVLDSLDGKLARMTFRFSEHADWIDHGSVLPTRLGWYAGLGWHYSSGVWSSQAGMLTIITLVCIVLDDLNWAVAKRIFKRTLFDITDFDAKAHLFTHRRNDMFLMLSGYLMGLGLYSFYLICGWVVVTWIWHCTRIVYLSNDSSLSKERN